ncbi:hypothetical protein QN277_016430 [Acacia crassicarpa]|uniref:Uncharacterized protein n=1 Tax=Acacia crassicarpa TaxID=499986 RepID=A0AAE1MWL5_9FABA|nr:hypothetical protein QN277_016430 [Acacia crassicarpa]
MFSSVPRDISQQILQELVYSQRLTGASFKAFQDCSLQMRSVMRIFDGGNLEHKIMHRIGCMNYETTTWEVVMPDVCEKRVSYQFNGHVSIFGGEVTCTQ